MHNSNRQIKIGVVISYLTIGFTVVSGLIYTPWMISKIGQADFGLYTLATSLVTMLTIDLGLSQAVTRFISKYRAENDFDNIKKFLGIVFKLFIVLSFILLFLILIAFFNVDRIFVKLSDDEIEKVKVLLLIAGLYTVISFPFHSLDGILVSGEWFIFQKTIFLISKILTILLMVTALGFGYGLYSLVIVNAVVGIITIGFKISFLRKNDPMIIDWKSSDTRLIKRIFSFSIWVMVISIAQRFILNISPSILGITSGSKEIACFSAAITLEGFIWSYSTVLSGMLIPKVTKIVYLSKNSMNNILPLMIKVGRIQFILLGAVVSIVIVVGKDFFVKWLGIEFEKSYYVTLLLILPSLITIPQDVANTTLTVKNLVKYTAFSKIVISIIAATLSYFISYKFGSIGSGIGIFIGNIIGGVILMNIIYYRVLKIDIILFFKQCHFKLLLPFILVLILGLIMNYQIMDISWIIIIAKSISLLIIYGVTMYIIGLNQYEKYTLRGFFLRIKK